VSQRSLTALVAFAAALFLAVPSRAAEEDLYVRAGKLYTGRVIIEDVVLHVRDGKVVALLSAEGLALPQGARVLDRSDRIVAPGFVLTQWSVGSGKRDPDTLGARFRALDAYDSYGSSERLVARGITTAFLHPGRGRLATGEGAVVKLAGPAKSRLLRERAELCLEMGAGALRPPAKVKIPFPSSSDVPIEPARPQRPSSRSGLVPELASQLKAALAYDAARKTLGGGSRPALNSDLQALADAALGDRLRIDARRADDLRGVLELAKSLGLEITLSGGTEAHAVLGPLAGLGAPLVFEVPHGLRGGLRDQGSDPDRLQARWSTPARLAKAGVRFALAPPPGGEADLRLLAALTVRGGLAHDEAFAAITHRAAQVLGVGKRVGHLNPGADADFVVLSGRPLATSTEVLETWVGGQRVFRAAASANKRALVVKAGTVITSAGPMIHNGEVLIEDGTIAAVGTSVPHPRGARVIDAGPDAVVTPGFIDAFGHLGLMGARSSRTSIARAFAGDRETLLRVARAGVTTAVVGPRRASGSGVALLAIKTAASSPATEALRRNMVLREPAAVIFDLSRADPLKLPSSFTGKLRAGVALAKRWVAYRKKLTAWAKARKAKTTAARVAAGKRRSAREPVKEKPKVKKVVKKVEKKEPRKKAKKKFDPISGTWEFTISFGGRSQKGILLLKLEAGGKISGVAKPPEGSGADDAPVSGRLDGKDVQLKLKPGGAQTPFEFRIKANLDREDHMKGEVLVGKPARFRLQFEATRTERSVPEIKIEIRRSKNKDGRPPEPRSDPVTQGLRAAIEGRGAVIVMVRHPRVALDALAELKKLGIHRVVFLDFSDADLVAKELAGKGAGILLVPGTVVKRGKRYVSLASDLSRLGLSLAFGSRAADGAAELPLRALVDVAAGLDPAKALAAMTNDAARLLALDDRVGSLEVGKDGDLLIFNGPPLEATSRLETVIVRGRRVLKGGE
jgi:imidazolonepropionase-like amidohydrolase